MNLIEKFFLSHPDF